MPEISAGPAQSGLSIQSVEFEPIGSGKNVVYVSVSNPMAKQKVFLVDIRTDGRTGWERQYTATLNAGETRRVHCAFSFVGAIAKDSSIRLRFYEPVSAGSWDVLQERNGVCAKLSEREMEVLRQFIEGKSSQEVAEALSCTPRTVGFHLANIYRKLQVSNRMQALRRAMAIGLVN